MIPFWKCLVQMAKTGKGGRNEHRDGDIRLATRRPLKAGKWLGSERNRAIESVVVLRLVAAQKLARCQFSQSIA